MTPHGGAYAYANMIGDVYAFGYPYTGANRLRTGDERTYERTDVQALRALALPRKGRGFARCSRRDGSPRPALACATSLSARARVRTREPHGMTGTGTDAPPVHTRHGVRAPCPATALIPAYGARHRARTPRPAIQSAFRRVHAVQKV